MITVWTLDDALELAGAETVGLHRAALNALTDRFCTQLRRKSRSGASSWL